MTAFDIEYTSTVDLVDPGFYESVSGKAMPLVDPFSGLTNYFTI